MKQYKYQFFDGFNIIEQGVAEMRYIRIRGIELAIEHNKKIGDRVLSNELNKWQDLGYSFPDETYHPVLGGVFRLDKEGLNFWKEDKNHEWYEFKRN